jgi:hypothetical protein
MAPERALDMGAGTRRFRIMAQFYAVHMYNLKPEVSKAVFESFMVHEYIQFVMKKKGCTGAMLLKGYVGEWTDQKYDYATIEIWESSKANRDAWGGPRKDWTTPPELRPFMDRFRAYAQPETFRTLEFELAA